MTIDYLSFALKYAQQGWNIFPVHSIRNSQCSCGKIPCNSAGKHPQIENWQNKSSHDPQQICDWWIRWPDANIGIATGSRSNLIVFDVDAKNGGKESLKILMEEFGELPKTFTVASGGGGFHFYFKYPNLKISNRANLRPGLDVRGDGGFIVAPPSNHMSKGYYKWIHDDKNVGISAAPDWLLTFITQPKKFVHNMTIGSGNRNNFLTQEAGKLRRVGCGGMELYHELVRMNHDFCTPPLENSEVEQIAQSISKYPTQQQAFAQTTQLSWPTEPEELPPLLAPVPTLPLDLIPETLRPWIADVAERMQVSYEFVMAPALVALSAVVGRKICIFPKQWDNWRVVANIWGAIVARPGYFKSPTIAEALKPLERLIDAARKDFEESKRQSSSAETVALLQLEAIKEQIKKAIKDGNQMEVDNLRDKIEEVERHQEEAKAGERRYKTNDATVEKVARLLNDNPNGILLLRDELNGWLQTLNKAGREGDREFYLEAWNGYGSYTVDRVGSGTLHVPALCLSVFGGIQPGKLQDYVEKALKGSTEDDGLLQRFQLLIYPDVAPNWENIDRCPNQEAVEKICELFEHLDDVDCPIGEEEIPGVRFSAEAQELFNSWRTNLEKRLRSGDIDCPAFESHLAKYRSLMPSLALLFWILEDPHNISAKGKVSETATRLAIGWCEFLERHAAKVYQLGQSTQNKSIRMLASRIENGDISNDFPVRTITRKQWRGLKNPEQVQEALGQLEDLGWIRVVKSTVQGGLSKRVHIHPKLMKQGSANYGK